MEKLTSKQREILDIIKRLYAKNGYAPSIREIKEMTNFSSTASIKYHLDKLAELGYIEKNNNRNRCIKLLVRNEYLDAKENLVSIPVLNENRSILFSKELLNGTKDLFIMKSKNKYSFIDIGDVIIVQKKSSYNKDDLVINDNYLVEKYKDSAIGKIKGIYKNL